LPLHEFTWSKQTEQAGLQRDSLYLIRPDGHVALADLKQDVTKLRSFVSKFKITTLRPRAEPTHYREAAGSS
jgi:hypothetical protein